MPDELQYQVLETCLGLATYGMGSVIGGHVSVRVPGERKFWTNAFDRTFEEMTIDDIFLLDFDGNNLSGGRMVSIGIGFHPGIYELRPDAGAVVHTHSYWVTAQAAFARAPKPWHNLSTYFHGRTAVSPDDTIEAIAPSLKPRDVAIVIPWHGAITIGADVAEAAALHATWDFACRLDVDLSATQAEPLSDEACDRIQELLSRSGYLPNTWELLRRRAARAYPERLDRPALVS